MPKMTVGDVMNEFGMMNVSSEETADSVSGRILSGRVGIVRAPTSLPIGVLTRKTYFTLQGVDQTLGEQRELIAPVGLTTPDTHMIEVVRAVGLNRGIHWYLAMNGGEVAGYIAPGMLFNLIKSNKNFGQVFVNPHGSTDVACYCCQPQPPDTMHDVKGQKLYQNVRGGIKHCPDHNVPLIIKSPCPNGC